ncbi:MAG: hypothetical protein ABR567_10310 [Myxococcales bacterium]
MTVLFAMLLLAQAAAPPQGEIPAAASIHARKRIPSNLKVVEGHLVGFGGEVVADDVLDEMLDEFAADVARLGAGQVGPILLRRVRVSDNVNPAYAAVVEAKLAAAVFRSANVALVRCVECNSTRSRVDGAEWVVTRGITTREEAQSIARKYGARSFLDVALDVRERPAPGMGMEVEMVRAEDSSIAFAETYRMDAAQGMLYRGADRAQSREARLKELEDRLNQRPRWGGALEFGAMGFISGGQNLWGATGRFNLVEQFGDDREFQAGLSAAGFFNFPGAPLSVQAGIVSALVQARAGRESLFVPKIWYGLDLGVLLTGSSASPIFGATVRWVVGERIALHFALRYMALVHIPNSTQSFGEIAPEAGVGFQWN